MPFTNINTVREHLSESGAVFDDFHDLPVQLSGTTNIALTHSGLIKESVKVKGKEIGAPLTTKIVLGDSDVSLSDQQLIPDSVVVAADDSLSKIYTENIDYHVDYTAGKVNRITSGTITSGDEVTVWYYRYKIHEDGIDFYLNNEQGLIRRISSGVIEDGQVVYIDYKTTTGIFAESQISSAIREADDIVLRQIDSDYHSSTNQTLITAETYLALSILCRMKAVSSLGILSSGKSNATDWLSLSRSYDLDARKLLAKFTAPQTNLSSPVTSQRGEQK